MKCNIQTRITQHQILVDNIIDFMKIRPSVDNHENLALSSEYINLAADCILALYEAKKQKLLSDFTYEFFIEGPEGAIGIDLYPVSRSDLESTIKFYPKEGQEDLKIHFGPYYCQSIFSFSNIPDVIASVIHWLH